MTMKKLMLAMVLGAAFALQGALKDELPDDYGLKVDLTSATEPGTPLKNNTVYTVRGDVLINAKANAGMSGLKVPVGVSAVIEIPKGCSLTVIGGDAEEMIGAGAGIEVPMGAKLVICGEGKLTALGGSAAPGEDGHKGLSGEVMPLLDLKTFPIEKLKNLSAGDVFKAMFGAGPITEALKSILFVGKGGSGGAGGSGGGGAAAGIGGKGGRGGKGGAETVGRRVVPASQFNLRQRSFEEWFDLLGWEHPYVYGYSTWNLKNKQRTLNGATGAKGAKGSSGMACGEIIIAESVQISAQPGFAAAGGKNGTCGKARAAYDMDHDNTQIWDFVKAAIKITYYIVETVLGEDDDGHELYPEKEDKLSHIMEKLFKMLGDDSEEDTSQKLWFYGGGGGAGGAGGAAAVRGIGPGGAGGGGGGSGGSGLFIVGSCLADPEFNAQGLEANGHGGLGGAAYIPEGADVEQVRAASFGQDASVLLGGESLGFEGKKEEAESKCFNLYDNSEAKAFWRKSGLPEHANDHLRLGCWTTNYKHDHLLAPELLDDCFAYAGLPGLGGSAGTVPLNYLVYKSPTATEVVGLDADKTTNYSGKVFCKLTLVIGGGQPDTTDWFVCGTAVAPCVVPAGPVGKIFAGFFTKPDGKGIQYFDKFGNPSSYPFIADDTTLYAHWVAEDVDLGIRECTYVKDDRNAFWTGMTLETGRIYYFTESIERDARAIGKRCAGVRIANNPGKTVVFYIPKDVTVTFGGADGRDRNPGFAGIEVPEGVTLVVTGEGTLVATGGSAGQARDGAIGGDGSYTWRDGLGEDYVTGGTGGSGGWGAGGAAAAIGGNGGQGGQGGDYTFGNDVKCWNSRTNKNGNDGKPGKAGGEGGACGNVTIVGTVSVELQGGWGTDGGAGGVAGQTKDDEGSHNAKWYTGTGGGGGAGGGGSSDALTIGGGAGGGGGGGGGGSGATVNNDKADVSGAKGQGGFGGLAAIGCGTVGGTECSLNGLNGQLPDLISYRREVYGGKGGGSGAAGATGANGTYSRGLKLSVTSPEFGDREALGDTDYVFGHPALQRTITFACRGEKLGSVLAMMGEPLPTVAVEKLMQVKGFDFGGAYRLDADGFPALDDFGEEDWWYDEFGYGEKTYDVPGDVTLEVHMEPKWYAMAEWPDAPDFTYDGKPKRVFETVDADAGFTVVGGTLVATNAGTYAVQLKLKDGYEVWSDADWNDGPEVTNDVRTWTWSIEPASADVTFENQSYDWNETNNVFRFNGKIPPHMTTSFFLGGMYAPGVYEVMAALLPEGDECNYAPDVQVAVCTIPEAVTLEGVLPFYPWDTGVAVDFTLVEEFADSLLTRYTNLTLCATIQTGDYIDIMDTNSVTVLKTVAVTEAALGYGTLVADFADAFPQYRGKVWLWFAVDGVPASELVEVAVDTTATADPATGAPVYLIEDVKNDIFPINYSWRFTDGDWNYYDPVRLSLGGAFAPVGEQGYSSNEGAADFTPTTNGQHKVALMIGQPDESSHYSKGEYMAIFEVNDPTLAGGGSPGAPGKVIRNQKSGEGSPRYGSYSTLAEALADYEYGDIFYIYGDVQGENVEIPSGATVLLVDAAARIRPPYADAARPWLAVAPVRDDAGNIYGYTLGCNGEKVSPKFGPDENGEFFRYEVVDDVTNIVFSVTNTYHGLYYSVDYKLNESDEWLDGELTPGSNGITYVSSPHLGEIAYYSPRVTDDPTVYPPLTYAKNADGTYKVTGVKQGATVSGLLKVPAVHRGQPVTALGEAVFKDQTAVTEFQLPLTLGEIPADAFSGCTGLTGFDIPVGVTNIGARAFGGCANIGRTLVLPESMEQIGASAFAGCTSLMYVEIPSSCTTLGTGAFAEATKLEAVYFDGNAPTAGENPFPADTTLYVKKDATGFGDVPGTWMGCKTVAWPNGLEVGQHLVGAIHSKNVLGGSLIRTGYCHNPDTRIECRFSDPGDGYSEKVVFFGGSTEESTAMGFQTSDSNVKQVCYVGGEVLKSSTSEEGKKFPFEPASGCRWSVDLTCDAKGARWTSGDSWNANNQLTSVLSSLSSAREGQDICIFGQDDGTGKPIDGHYASITLGWFKIYEENSLLHDFRPCKDLRTDAVGLFDTVGDKLFRSCANLEPLKDPLPELDPKPDANYYDNYTNLNYICVTGVQYACLVDNPLANEKYNYVGGIDGYGYFAWQLSPSRYGEGQGSEIDPALIKPLLVFEDKKLIRHLLPCERASDQVKGLYDLVTKTFFESANADAPFALRLPPRYREVEYIETRNHEKYYEDTGSGSGAIYMPYIDTEYVPTSATEMSIAFRLHHPDFATVHHGASSVFGFVSASDWAFCLDRGMNDDQKSKDALTRNSYALMYGFGKKYESNYVDLELPYGKRIEATCDASKFAWLVEGAVAQQSVALPSAGSLDGNSVSLCLFSGYEYRAQGMRLWSCRISEGGVLKRNFIPCVDTEDLSPDDNKPLAGLYDLVEKKFHHNKNWLDGDTYRHTDYRRFGAGPDAVYPNASEE